LYEYRSNGEPNGSFYVGMAWGNGIKSRLRRKPDSYGRNWDNVTLTYIDFPTEEAGEAAERVRLEQLWVSEGISNVVQNNPRRLTNVMSRDYAIKFMQRGDWQHIPGWPGWLKLPTNMIQLPPGWR
jgi:hypothetical protein